MPIGSSRHIDRWSLVVILVTLVLFLVALSAKGFTHDMLLEAAVFLVSVKLILMAYKSRIAAEAIDRRLRQIEHLLRSSGVPKDRVD